MAKLTRESRLRERRMEKQAKKTARKLEPDPLPEALGGEPHEEIGESSMTGVGSPLERVADALTDV